MITATVRHSVSDFDTWKPVFDEHGSVRAKHGASNTRVLHDGNNVLVPQDASSYTAYAGVRGDLAIKDGRIAALGEVKGSAARTIDAEGLDAATRDFLAGKSTRVQAKLGAQMQAET